jgi:alpha-glucosidase
MLLRISILLLSLSSLIIAQHTPIIDQTKSLVQFEVGSDDLLFQACTEEILKINFLKNGIKHPSTLATLDKDYNYSGAIIQTAQNQLTLLTSKFTLIINLTNLAFEIFDDRGTSQITFNSFNNIGAYHFNADIYSSDYYGVDNRDNGFLTSNSGGYISAGSQGSAGAPFIWSPEGMGILIDTDGGEINLSTNRIEIARENTQQKEDLLLYFIFGTPKEIFKGLTVISGNTPLMPKYTFGFMNTEWGLDEDELRNDILTYRSKQIPIDAYILDFDWMAWGEDNYGEFRWGDRFPGGANGDLKIFLDTENINLMGIRKPRIHVNTVPGYHVHSQGLDFDITTDYWSNQEVYRLNFHKEETRKWYYDKFINEGNAYQTGITGYWNDEADEYGGNFMFLQMQRGNYEGQRDYNNQRVWSINRNFYLGAQRYAYAHWSGDIPSGFASMARQRLFMLSSINLGSAWWGMDIGGFHSGTPSAENYYRWIQFGAFVPVFRVHGEFNQEREPWNFGALAEQIATKYIRMRYELIPYINNAAWENHLNGTPLVKPFVMVYPDDPLSRQYYDGFFFGNDIIVYPVVVESALQKQIYIPEGTWIDYFNGKKYYGPANYNYLLSNHDIPIFMRDGAVLPKKIAGNFVGDPASDSTLILECYTGNNGGTLIYEDDGLTYDYETGEFSTTEVNFYSSTEMAFLNIEPRVGNYISSTKNILAKFRLTDEEPDSVLLNDISLQFTSEEYLLNNDMQGWYYNADQKIGGVKFYYDGSNYEVKVFLGEDLIEPEVDSVKMGTATQIDVYFSENILIDDSENGALNLNNYTITNGIVIDSIQSFGGTRIKLYTSEHTEDIKYQITIENIVDLSSSANIMSPTIFEYTYDPLYIYVFQNGLEGYKGTSDTHIAEYFPNNNMGGNSEMECARFGGDHQDDKSILIKFDFNISETDTSKLEYATLNLTMTDNRNGSPTKLIGAYRLMKDWNQGNKNTGIDGTSATTSEATWISAKNNQVYWNNAGGDFEAIPYDEVNVGSLIGGQYEWKLAKLVKFWIANPDSNFGLILREKNPSTLNGTKVFASSENNAQEIRPKMVMAFKDGPITNAREIDEVYPKEFALHQNYPNPFNPTTTINFSIADHNNVTLIVYDILGRKVVTLVNERKAPGRYSLAFDGSSLSSGIYFYKLEAGKFSAIKKLMLVK